MDRGADKTNDTGPWEEMQRRLILRVGLASSPGFSEGLPRTGEGMLAVGQHCARPLQTLGAFGTTGHQVGRMAPTQFHGQLRAGREGPGWVSGAE